MLTFHRVFRTLPAIRNINLPNRIKFRKDIWYATIISYPSYAYGDYIGQGLNDVNCIAYIVMVPDMNTRSCDKMPRNEVETGWAW